MSRLRLPVVLLALLLLPPAVAAKSTRAGGEALFPALREDARKLVEVTTVVEMAGQPVVLLTEPESGKVLPIFIGHSEAMAIALRLQGTPFDRPLTHDLLDAVLRELGGSVAAVEVSSLEDDVFLAVLSIKRPDGSIARLDARPSDSIALAVGAKAPVYVAHKVLAAAALDAGAPAPSPTPRRGSPL